MPELPEVETSRRGIEPHILNKKISEVIIRQHRLRWPIPETLPSIAEGQVIRSVERRAKYLLLRLDNGTIIIHLGMSGSLRICSKNTAAEKHDHIDICVSDDKLLRLRDPRKFGCVLWTDAPIEDHKLIEALGPEPLERSFDAEYLHKKAMNRSCAIKSLIMNSHIVVGVGNIYASESLFKAGINPRRKAGNISRHRLHGLVIAIKEILRDSIEQGGTTLKDFTAEDGQPGYFAQKLLVYGRAGEPCTRCHATIKQITQQQRSTYYCPQCQR